MAAYLARMQSAASGLAGAAQAMGVAARRLHIVDQALNDLPPS